MSEKTYDVAVVGAGGAGTMAFLRAVLNCDDSVLFAGDAKSKRRGRSIWVAEVDNIPGMHGFKNPITSTTRSTLAWIASQASLAEKATVVKAAVSKLQCAGKSEGDGFILTCSTRSGETSYRARYVIIATGIMDVQPEIGGSIEPILPFANRGDVVYCLRCDGHKTIGHRLSVIGHGKAGLSIANLMHERYGLERIKVLTHGQQAETDSRAARLAASYGVEVLTSPIVEVLGDAKKGNGLEGYLLEDGTRVDTDRSIVALGTIVYTDLLMQLGVELAENGRVDVSDVGETTVPGLFVVGDLVAGKKMQIYTAWDEAVDAAEEVNRRLRARRRAAAG